MEKKKLMTDSKRISGDISVIMSRIKQSDVSIFWFRRDLRLNDNTGLYHALKSGRPVILLFIFDDEILKKLPVKDARVSFIYDKLEQIHIAVSGYKSSVMVLKGDCIQIWKNIAESAKVKSVFWNNDYEPYAQLRDGKVKNILRGKGIEVCSYKDHVIFEKDEVIKDDSSPYTVFTPYARRWLRRVETSGMPSEKRSEDYLKNLAEIYIDFPGLNSTGLKRSDKKIVDFRSEKIKSYDKYRDYPYMDASTYAGPHLRFGTISIRELAKTAIMVNITYLNELIWREFFMQILFHFPHVVENSFKPKYDGIKWLNDEEKYDKWCKGETGYPLVDAGMRQLNATGFMHNRIRMVTASFLCKHLLIDWRWGERYFSEKLLDYELSSNNGNWQWAAGTGCDAAPYFRVFNPYEQAKKFDRDNKYILEWIPELNTGDYPPPIIDHSFARKRAIETYRYYLNLA
ncbi:MAG: deoxyribodipyrimidine photo-lyase [Bacteroidales bacterium]|nr:deoxyribodipyrimidine photo-lyase [Bacteroidales bacterium]